MSKKKYFLNKNIQMKLKLKSKTKNKNNSLIPIKKIKFKNLIKVYLKITKIFKKIID